MENTKRRRFFHVLLLLLAVAAPFCAVLIARGIASLDVQSEIISTRTVCGVIIGQLIGLRRGNLRDFILGPVFGLAAGIADLRVFIWLFQTCQWSISAAGLVPIWGAVLGILVAGCRQSWPGRLIVFSLITAADFGSRWLWDQAFQQQWLELGDQSIWIAAAAVYLPTSLLAVVLSRKRGPCRTRPPIGCHD